MARFRRPVTVFPARLLTTGNSDAIDADAGSAVVRCDGVARETEPVGIRPGEIRYEVGGPLQADVRAFRMGRAYQSVTKPVLFRDPDTVSIPDLSYTRSDRLAPDGERSGIAPYPPACAVEVLSPPGRLAWLVGPREHTITVHATETQMRTLHGGAVLPGFALPVVDIFLENGGPPWLQLDC